MTDHSGCKYFYETMISEEKTTYEALRDKDIVSSRMVKAECCGVEPLTIILDKDQPLCRFYKRRERERM